MISRRGRLLLAVGASILVTAAAAVVLRADLLSSRSASDEAQVEQAVMEYNLVLPEAFAAMDMGLLNTVATRDQAYTEYYQMSALAEAGVVLHATLTDIKLLDIQVQSDTTSTVDTVETWDYRQVSRETSATVRAETGVVYRLTYRLVKQHGRWLVHEIKTTGEEWRQWPGSAPPSVDDGVEP